MEIEKLKGIIRQLREQNHELEIFIKMISKGYVVSDRVISVRKNYRIDPLTGEHIQEKHNPDSIEPDLVFPDRDHTKLW